MYEIGVADLRLNDLEAGLLLNAAGVELDPSEISELTDETEGWPAGLYLAALSMQAGAPSPVDAEGFKGDDRFVAEYFRLELLSRLPAAEAQFLKHTSVLDRMSGRLCDSVLQTTHSADKLERSRVRTDSSCPSTGGASGIATTTSSASCCGTSSSEPSLTSCPDSTLVRWSGVSPTA